MYAIARIIGTGTPDDPYRADAEPYGPCVIPSNPDGSPKYGWCLMKLHDFDNTTGTDLFKLPKVSLSTTVGDISPSKRAAIKTKLDGMGVDTSWITLDTTLREIVKKIGKHLDVNFKDMAEGIS